MLIDTREPPPLPPPAPRRVRRPSGLRPLLRLLAGLGLALLSGAFPPVPAYILLLGACISIGRGLGAVVGNPSGLKDYRQ